VRIEDDILVTANGSRNLSSGLPRQVEEIEAWMAALWSQGSAVSASELRQGFETAGSADLETDRPPR